MLAGHNCNRREMSIDGEHIVAVIQLHLAAIPGAQRRSGNVPVGRRAHRRSVGCFNVQAGMEGAFTVERVLTRAKARSHAAFNRPHRWRIGKLLPIAGKGGRKAALQCARNPARERLRPQSIKLIDGELQLLLVYVVGQRQAGGSGLQPRLAAAAAGLAAASLFCFSP